MAFCASDGYDDSLHRSRLLIPSPPMSLPAELSAVLDSDPSLFDIQTKAAGPTGALPLTEELLREAPSGDLFGWTMDVGMGCNPADLGRPEVLILSLALTAGITSSMIVI